MRVRGLKVDKSIAVDVDDEAIKNTNATLFFSLASGSVGTSQRGQAVLVEDENDLQRSGRIVHRLP